MSSIYVSYHNLDLAFAFALSRLLISCYREVWLDRFEVAPAADWSTAIREARPRSTSVIAVVSDDYLASAYCRAECEDFMERGIPVTAVIARDFSTEAMSDFAFSDWVDCRRAFDNPTDMQTERLLSQFPQSEHARQTGERLEYLLQFIQDMVCALARMPTAWAAMRMKSDIRPRLLPAGWLRDGHFAAIQEGEPAEVSDLLAWAERQGSFRLTGEAGSGKTCLARMLALAQAHAALRDEAAALPIWLDMTRWDAAAPTLDDFMEANWRLLSYWRHWTESHPGLIFLDDWSALAKTCPELAEAIAAWLVSSAKQRYVVLATPATDGDSEPGANLPIIQLGRPNAALAQKLAGDALTLEQQNSLRQILKRKRALIEDSPLAYLAIGIELLSADRALANTEWQRDPAAAVLRLRDHLLPARRFGLRMEAARDGLEDLAWAMMTGNGQREVLLSDALDCLRDRRIIEYALAIGILVESGAGLRFESEVMQACLVASRLKDSGVLEHLRPALYDAESGRLPSRWDLPTMLLADSLDEHKRLDLLSEIAATDPILAGFCLRRHPSAIESAGGPLLEKLVDHCAEAPAARRAFRNLLASVPQPERAADLLIGQRSRLNNQRQIWLWHEIAKLPLAPPPAFLESLDADAHEDKASGEILSLTRRLAYLVALSQGEDRNLRRNAIAQMSRLKVLPLALFLLDCLDRENTDDSDAILESLIHFAHSEVLARLLHWARSRPGRCELLISALAAGKRPVTSRLLAMAEARELTLAPSFFPIAATWMETDIALGLAQVAARFVDLPESVGLAITSSAKAEWLQTQIAGAIKHKPNKEAFRQLVEDIASALNDPPEATVIAGSKLEALLYGETVFDEISEWALDSPATGRYEPEESTPPDEQSARLQAIVVMGAAPVEDALPLLLEATNDSDPRIRLAAYEALAEHKSQVAAQKAMLAGLADADPAVVEKLIELLPGMGLADYDVLYELLDSADADAVAAAIAVLAASEAREAIKALSGLLDDERLPNQGGPAIGTRARDAISALRAGDAPRPDQAHTAKQTPDYSAGEKVRRALQVLRDDNWGRTQKAARFLRSFARHSRGEGSGAIRQLLCSALQDDNWSLRWAAAEALGILHDREAIPAVCQALNDDTWIVQVAAVRALIELRATDATAQLLPLLGSQRPQLREAAAEALGLCQDGLATEQLSQTLAADPDDFVRLAALKAICQIGSRDRRRWLDLALSDSCIDIRLFAMRALAPDMDDSDLPILRKLLDDDRAPSYESQSLRDLALETLRRVDSQECRALLASHHELAEQASA